MNLGFVTAILPEFSFEELVDFAAQNGFSRIEVMCWPKGKAERRYAGVSHIDVDNLDEEKAKAILDYAADRSVWISGLGYYPNTLDPDPEKRQVYVEHIKKCIAASSLLGVNLVNTFIGRDQNKTVEENLEIFKEVWTPIIAYAEKTGVKVAIENCPMLFTLNEWPGGQNLATTPAIWRQMFKLIDSPNFGINYDPSHFIWQQIDYIKPLYEFKDKIFHVHFKDIKIFRDKLDNVGIMAPPLNYMTPKLPGFGDVNWGRYISALTDIGYKGDACIEVEDKAFENSLEERKQSLLISRNYIKQFFAS